MFKSTALAEIGGFLSFCAVVILYAIALAGSSSHHLTKYSVIELFTNTTDAVHLGLGYLGFCISLPNLTTISAQGNLTTTASPSACTTFLSFPTGEPAYLLDQLLALQNLTELPSAGYNSSVAALLDTARTFRHSAFEPQLLLAAYALFVFFGLVFCVVAICHCCRRTKTPGRGTFYFLAAIVLSVSVSSMLAGGATFALVQGQKLVAEAVAATGGFSPGSPRNSTQPPQQEERVFVNVGDRLKTLLYSTLAGTGFFVLALAVTFGRRAAHRPDMPHLESAPSSFQFRFEFLQGLPIWPTSFQRGARRGGGGARKVRR